MHHRLKMDLLFLHHTDTNSILALNIKTSKIQHLSFQLYAHTTYK